MAALAAALALPPPPARAQGVPAAGAEVSGDPLVQRGVPAEASAENAVVARDRALASGQRIAYERMAAALGLPARLPDSQIDALVQSLVIESERVTPTRYIARITVNFNAARVAQAGGRPAVSAAPAAPGLATPVNPGGPAVTTLEAVARYRSFPEWVELKRRLSGAAPVARVEVVTIAPDMARLRLGLRAPAAEAASGMAASGLDLAPEPMARPGEGWRLSLAGGR